MIGYPRRTALKGIRICDRVCCKCGGGLPGGKHTTVLTLIRGKYVCAKCEEEARLRREYGTADRELIERIKMYSIDAMEGKHGV